MIFCDTSAAAKLYVPEKDSAAVRVMLESEDQIFISEFARVELMSVFHRQLREKIWSRHQFTTATRQFMNDDNNGFWTWLPMSPVIVEAAARTYATLPDSVFLRSADCIHLITAIHHGFTDICTFDKHQTGAAVALGLSLRRP